MGRKARTWNSPSGRWAPPIPMGIPAVGVRAADPQIVLRVDDCRKTYAEMKARGVSFRTEPTEYPYATSAAFSDPDDNVFAINQPKKFE